jgi:bacillithiol system protein YtxJ
MGREIVQPTIRELLSIEDWHVCMEDSYEAPQLLLKHSTACPISAEALKEFKIFISQAKRKMQFAMVKVIESRSVSNEIAEEMHLKHESPQVLLIRDQEVLWHTSHWNITVEKLEQEINSRI